MRRHCVATGLSLTALTVTPAVSVALENAELPPFVAVLTLLPAVPLVWSQARNVMPSLTVPLKFELPWK